MRQTGTRVRAVRVDAVLLTPVTRAAGRRALVHVCHSGGRVRYRGGERERAREGGTGQGRVVEGSGERGEGERAGEGGREQRRMEAGGEGHNKLW